MFKYCVISTALDIQHTNCFPNQKKNHNLNHLFYNEYLETLWDTIRSKYNQEVPWFSDSYSSEEQEAEKTGEKSPIHTRLTFYWANVKNIRAYKKERKENRRQ